MFAANFYSIFSAYAEPLSTCQCPSGSQTPAQISHGPSSLVYLRDTCISLRSNTCNCCTVQYTSQCLFSIHYTPDHRSRSTISRRFGSGVRNPRTFNFTFSFTAWLSQTVQLSFYFSTYQLLAEIETKNYIVYLLTEQLFARFIPFLCLLVSKFSNVMLQAQFEWTFGWTGLGWSDIGLGWSGTGLGPGLDKMILNTNTLPNKGLGWLRANICCLGRLTIDSLQYLLFQYTIHNTQVRKRCSLFKVYIKLHIQMNIQHDFSIWC